jgi:hypothetical protein
LRESRRAGHGHETSPLRPTISLHRPPLRSGIVLRVLIASLIVATSNDSPLAIVAGDFAVAKILGLVVFVSLVVALYGWMLRRQKA